MSDIIIGKHGDTLTGRVLTDPFSFRSAFGDLEVPRDQTWRVHIDTGHPGGPDQIVLKTSDSLDGTLLTDPIEFRREGGEEMKIPKTVIHTIHMGLLFDKKAPRLGEGE